MNDSAELVLRVRDWDSIYENARSQQIRKLSWVMVPNGHDGTGYRMVISRTDGLEVLGAWLIILQVASQCTPRGTLLRANGKPHTAISISAKTGARTEILQNAIDVLLNDDIAWLESVSCTSVYTKDVHLSTLNRTEQNRTERDDTETLANGTKKATPPLKMDYLENFRSASLALGVSIGDDENFARDLARLCEDSAANPEAAAAIFVEFYQSADHRIANAKNPYGYMLSVMREKLYPKQHQRSTLRRVSGVH